jgi:transcriptional regulator with XRE-family HTH domain
LVAVKQCSAHGSPVSVLRVSDSFPPNLRRVRHQAGLSQEELAFRAGVTRNYVGGLERGEKSPTLRTLDKLAEALGTSPLDLLREPAE